VDLSQPSPVLPLRTAGKCLIVVVVVVVVGGGGGGGGGVFVAMAVFHSNAAVIHCRGSFLISAPAH